MHQKAADVTRKAINQAAQHGVEVTPDRAIEDLERAAHVLQAQIQLDPEPLDLAKLTTALATVHTALHRIRVEAAKHGSPDLSVEEIETQALALLRARGWRCARGRKR